MLITHTLQVVAVCPVDGKPDVYECTVLTSRIIPVEEIVAAVVALKDRKAYQEDVCQELHRQLACEVKLVGYHSGVKTEVVCR